MEGRLSSFSNTAFLTDAFSISAFDFGITNTPGRIRNLALGQFRIEDEDEKLARRIREGTIQLPSEPVQAPKDDSAYFRESARVARQIAQARQEAAESRRLIAEYEAQADILRQSEIVQAKLLRAQQALIRAEIEEAVRLEEMEVMDIAFFAVAALSVTRQ